MSTSELAASALPTNGVIALAPYTAPAASAPLRMKLERVTPWTSTAASSGLAESRCVMSGFPLWVRTGLGDERLHSRQNLGHAHRLGERPIGSGGLLQEQV